MTEKLRTLKDLGGWRFTEEDKGGDRHINEGTLRREAIKWVNVYGKILDEEGVDASTMGKIEWIMLFFDISFTEVWNDGKIKDVEEF